MTASQAWIERTSEAIARSAVEAFRQQQIIDRESARSRRDRRADDREERRKVRARHGWGRPRWRGRPQVVPRIKLPQLGLERSETLGQGSHWGLLWMPWEPGSLLISGLTL